MALTGFKQSTIAYLVDAATGEPLDVNGVKTSQSGRRQAIALLAGVANPNPTLYEVLRFFNGGEILNGQPSRIYDPLACPPQTIRVFPARQVSQVNGEAYTLSLYSTGPWTVASNPVATLSAYSGEAGYADIVVQPLAIEAQHDFTFQLTGVVGATAVHRLIVAQDINAWILSTGFWNNLAFWSSNGIWNY